jgi:SAM-dependent methyltransferase
MLKKTLKQNKQILSLYKRLRFRGENRYCLCCDRHSSVFFDFAIPPALPRSDAECPQCGSLERHRLLASFLKEYNILSSSTLNILHIAPEPAVINIFKSKIGNGNYITADLFRSDVSVRLDLCRIPFCNDYFDLIVCNHVLEHIEDDLLAMKELYRVLSKNGKAVISVPIDYSRELTYEDFTIISPRARAREFGQEDHVRIYGKDFISRLNRAGFKVEAVRGSDLVSESQTVLMGITQAAGELYVCTK